MYICQYYAMHIYICFLTSMILIVFWVQVCPIQIYNPINGVTTNRARNIFFDFVRNVSFGLIIGHVISMLRFNEFIYGCVFIVEPVYTWGDNWLFQFKVLFHFFNHVNFICFIIVVQHHFSKSKEFFSIRGMCFVHHIHC